VGRDAGKGIDYEDDDEDEDELSGLRLARMTAPPFGFRSGTRCDRQSNEQHATVRDTFSEPPGT
jgi:hypothetical protein